MTENNSLDLVQYLEKIKQRKEKEENITYCLGIGILAALAKAKNDKYKDPFTTQLPERDELTGYQKYEFRALKEFLKEFKKGYYPAGYNTEISLNELKEIYKGNLEKISVINIPQLTSLDNIVKNLIGREGIGYARLGELFTSDELIQNLYRIADIKSRYKRRIIQKIISKQIQAIREHLLKSSY